MSDINSRITALIASEDIILFMKGVPAAPQCGFSAAVVNVLLQLGAPFKGVDVLADNAIREGVKAYSNWPTIPQLYVKGEFIGGADIVLEMLRSGELKSFMEGKGIALGAEA